MMHSQPIDTHLIPTPGSRLDELVNRVYETLTSHLPKHKSQHARYRNAVAVILANILCATQQQSTLIMPRNRTRWLNETQSQYGNHNLGYTVITNTQLWLAQHQWIEVRLGSGESLVNQETYGITREAAKVFATQKLMEAAEDINPFQDITSIAPEIVVLKPGIYNGNNYSLAKLRKYSEHDETEKLSEYRRFVSQLNHFTHNLDISYVGDYSINKAQTSYRKVFLSLDDTQPVRFDAGGRYYGHWAQLLPAQERHNIRINGNALSQVSIEGCLLALLYAKHSLRMSDHSPFALPEPETNASTLSEAVRITIEEMLFSTTIIDRKPKALIPLTPNHKWSKFQQLIYSMHPVLRKAAFSGEGLELAFHESELFTLVMQDLMPRNIPFVSIFDTLLVPVDKTETVAKTMQEVFSFYTKEVFHNPIHTHVLKQE